MSTPLRIHHAIGSVQFPDVWLAEARQMKIPILIETTPDQRYRATSGELFVGNVEGGTPEEALEKMKKLIEERIARGARIAALELPDSQNPWLEGAGMFRDDPFFDDWQQAITDYRREANQAADAP